MEPIRKSMCPRKKMTFFPINQSAEPLRSEKILAFKKADDTFPERPLFSLVRHYTTPRARRQVFPHRYKKSSGPCGPLLFFFSR